MLVPFLDLRLTDVIDILVVTALVYTVIAWIRRTHAAQAATGILIMGVFYVAARVLGLQLTAWILQGFFAIFVVMIVVIFQEELRQMFERVAVWSLRRRKIPAAPTVPTDLLIQCLSDFARDRIGALVVIPGRQPIQRHVQGGVELNGRLSLPLLKSIFDPHSPGHDGAALIEDGRLTRFAAHLPLSKDFRQLAGVGTRHSAALGLAELTDALCLVVSEERGRVSIAQDATLQQLQNPQELGQVLDRFFEQRNPSSQSRRAAWRQVLLANWAEKVVSLVLVAGLWYLFVPGSRPTQITYDVPVKVANLPEDYVLEDVSPSSVKVTFSAPARAFYLFDPNRLELTVDATLARLGRRTFEITDENLRHPSALSLEDLTPSRIKISVHKGSNGGNGELPANGD